MRVISSMMIFLGLVVACKDRPHSDVKINESVVDGLSAGLFQPRQLNEICTLPSVQFYIANAEKAALTTWGEDVSAEERRAQERSEAKGIRQFEKRHYEIGSKLRNDRANPCLGVDGMEQITDFKVIIYDGEGKGVGGKGNSYINFIKRTWEVGSVAPSSEESFFLYPDYKGKLLNTKSHSQARFELDMVNDLGTWLFPAIEEYIDVASYNASFLIKSHGVTLAGSDGQALSGYLFDPYGRSDEPQLSGHQFPSRLFADVESFCIPVMEKYAAHLNGSQVEIDEAKSNFCKNEYLSFSLSKETGSFILSGSKGYDHQGIESGTQGPINGQGIKAGSQGPFTNQGKEPGSQGENVEGASQNFVPYKGTFQLAQFLSTDFQDPSKNFRIQLKKLNKSAPNLVIFDACQLQTKTILDFGKTVLGGAYTVGFASPETLTFNHVNYNLSPQQWKLLPYAMAPKYVQGSNGLGGFVEKLKKNTNGGLVDPELRTGINIPGLERLPVKVPYFYECYNGTCKQDL